MKINTDEIWSPAEWVAVLAMLRHRAARVLEFTKAGTNPHFTEGGAFNLYIDVTNAYTHAIVALDSQVVRDLGDPPCTPPNSSL